MPIFKVTRTVIHKETTLVMADNEQQSIERVNRGEGILLLSFAHEYLRDPKYTNVTETQEYNINNMFLVETYERHAQMMLVEAKDENDSITKVENGEGVRAGELEYKEKLSEDTWNSAKAKNSYKFNPQL